MSDALGKVALATGPSTLIACQCQGMRDQRVRWPASVPGRWMQKEGRFVGMDAGRSPGEGRPALRRARPDSVGAPLLAARFLLSVPVLGGRIRVTWRCCWRMARSELVHSADVAAEFGLRVLRGHAVASRPRVRVVPRRPTSTSGAGHPAASSPCRTSPSGAARRKGGALLPREVNHRAKNADRGAGRAAPRPQGGCGEPRAGEPDRAALVR